MWFMLDHMSYGFEELIELNKDRTRFDNLVAKYGFYGTLCVITISTILHAAFYVVVSYV
jgi:hypothetical protein